MNLTFKNKVAVVTGSGRGIGRAIALGFAAEGANIVVNALHDENVSRVVEEVESAGAKTAGAIADVSTQDGVTRLFDFASKRFGTVDILINNAGTNIVRPAVEMTESDWDKVNSTNLKSAFLCSKASAAKFMLPQKRGRIINISSIVGITPFPNRSAYAATKAGVIMLTRELAIEWAKYNITVNAIAPGFFMTDQLMERVREGSINDKAILRRVPMGRFGDLKDLVNLTLFLASEHSNYITGQVIAVDGGYTSYGFPE